MQKKLCDVFRNYRPLASECPGAHPSNGKDQIRHKTLRDTILVEITFNSYSLVWDVTLHPTPVEEQKGSCQLHHCFP
jgi:hypothetical protein